MIEAEWQECADPKAMLAFLGSNAIAASNLRKLRLFACACARHVLPLLDDPRCRAAIEASERFADGLLSEEELEVIGEEARQAALSTDDEFLTPTAGEHGRRMANALRAAWVAASPPSEMEQAAGWTAEWVRYSVRATLPPALRNENRPTGRVGRTQQRAVKVLQQGQCRLLHCLFGNPFRPPVRIDVSWRTPIVTALAESIYEERRFGDLPVLADALEDSGCTDADILEHCRCALAPGAEEARIAHTLGCWVLDLLLDKK
jgi:hypothetical protein